LFFCTRPALGHKRTRAEKKLGFQRFFLGLGFSVFKEKVNVMLNFRQTRGNWELLVFRVGTADLGHYELKNMKKLLI